MAQIKILAGDFGEGHGEYWFGTLSLPWPGDWTPGRRHSVKDDIATLEEADERSVVKVGGAAGWGVAGALVAGPVGLLAGAILGGKGQRIAFVAEFNDGRRLMAECDKSTWVKMKADRFAAAAPSPKASAPNKDHTASRVILVVAFLVLIGATIGMISTQASAPTTSGAATQVAMKPTTPEPAAADATPPRPAATQATRRTTRTGVESIRRSARYEDCLAVMQDMQRQYPDVVIVDAPGFRVVRFPDGDGSTLLTCNRHDGVMILTTSPHR